MQTLAHCPQCNHHFSVASPTPSHCHRDAAPQPWYIEPLTLTIQVAFAIFATMHAPVHYAVGLTLGALYEVTMLMCGVKMPKAGGMTGNCGPGTGEAYSGRGQLPVEIVLGTAFYFFHHLEHATTYFAPALGCYHGVRVVDAIHRHLTANRVQTAQASH